VAKHTNANLAHPAGSFLNAQLVKVKSCKHSGLIPLADVMTVCIGGLSPSLLLLHAASQTV
jgi:hypothetical protein